MPVETAPQEAFTFTPLGRPVDGTVVVPGSKSITNRALPIAALARGTSMLTGALFSDDTRYMAEALDQLGIRVESDEANHSFTVTGGDGTFPAAAADLFIGNSGTSVRFLTAVLTLGHGKFRIDGIPRMRERPIQPLITALNDLGSTGAQRRRRPAAHRCSLPPMGCQAARFPFPAIRAASTSPRC